MSKSKRYRATALSQVLKDQGRHQRWLASRIGVTEATMSRVVNGTARINDDDAEMTARVLGVPLFLIFELAGGSNMNASSSKERIPA